MNRLTLTARSHIIRRLLLGGLAAVAMLASAAVGAPGAHADTPTITPGLFTLTTRANFTWSNNRLDSNTNRDVYLHVPNDGAYQKWQVEPAGDGYWYLRNLATGLMLDSNHDADVYTEPFNGGHYQQWRITPTADHQAWNLQDRATGGRLDVRKDSYDGDFPDDIFNYEHNYAHIYTNAPNSGAFQQWLIVPTTPAGTPPAPQPTPPAAPAGPRVTPVNPDDHATTDSAILSTPIGAKIQADLVVVSISGPTQLKAGLSGTYTVTLKNQGATAAALDLAIVFAGKLDQTDQIVAGAGLACQVKRGDAGINASVICNGGSLAAGATATVVVQGRGPSSGSGLLVVNVNPSRTVSESDYTNNTKQLAVTIA